MLEVLNRSATGVRLGFFVAHWATYSINPLMTGFSCSESEPTPCCEQQSHLVLMQIKHCQECIRIRLIAVHFDGGPQQWLREYKLSKSAQIHNLGIHVEKLTQKGLQPVEINLGLRIEELKIDVKQVGILAGDN